MSVDVKRVGRSIAIFVLFLGCIQCTLGDSVERNYCQTQGCQTAADDFNKLINWNQDICADFYTFACGNGPPEELSADKFRIQDQYLSDLFLNITSDEDILLTLDPTPSDPPVLQLIKRSYKSCTDQEALNAAGLAPIIRLLEEAVQHNTWWKIENWAVSLGFNSSLFSVQIQSHTERDDKKNAIILGPPHTPIYTSNYLDISIKVIEKLTDVGMDAELARKLRNGVVKELNFYTIIQDRSLPDTQSYGERNLVPLSEWNNLWNKRRSIPSNSLMMNVENYFNNFWKNSVKSDTIVPLLNNGFYKGWIEYPLFIETLGHKVEELKHDDMRDIILWRIANQLVQHAGQDMRNVLGLDPINAETCKTPALQDVAEKARWWKIYPKSIRTPIRNMYVNIDLQAKLINYKKLPKITPDKEALTPRERRLHDELYRMHGILDKKVTDLLTQINNAEAEIKRLKALTNPVWCISGADADSGCEELGREYRRAQIKIPELEEQVVTLSHQFNAKQAERLRCFNRVQAFEKKHTGRPYVDHSAMSTERIALINYARDKQYLAKFPYENTFTQPAFIIEPIPQTETYVDLALSMKRWERAKLLRETEWFRLVSNVEEFIMNTISQGTFARFRPDRSTSLNYGALGSVIGAQLQRKLNPLIRDGYRKVEECVAKGFGTGSESQQMYDLISDIFTVSNLRYGLQAAWNGFKRTVAITGEHDIRIRKDPNADNEEISKFNDGKLFFLAFANSHCSAEPDHTSQLFLNEIVGITPQFKNTFECTKVSAGYPPDPCIPHINEETTD